MSSTLSYIQRLAEDRRQHIPLGNVGLTELGWCTAVVLTMQRAGMNVSLMEGKAYAYRVANTPHSIEDQESFVFPFIALLTASKPGEAIFVDMLGNNGLPAIARASAELNYWEYAERGLLQYNTRLAEQPFSLDEDMQAYYQRIYHQLAEHLATMIASDLGSVTPACATARSPRL